MRADLYRSVPHVDAILLQRKGYSRSSLGIELTQMFYVLWVGQRHSVFHGKANASGLAYFCHLEGSFPAGGEFVEPFSV